jgi:hypothetical protein
MMMNDDDSREGEIFGTPEFRSAGFLSTPRPNPIQIMVISSNACVDAMRAIVGFFYVSGHLALVSININHRSAL